MDLFNKQSTLVFDNDKKQTVASVIEEGNLILSEITPRSLCILLCRNTFDSLFFYINFIDKRIVPILVDAETDKQLLQTLINDYSPDFVFSPYDIEIQNDDYELFLEYQNYRCFKSTNPSEIVLFEDLALLLTTSGTTGSPKLVRLTHKNLLSNAISISQYLNLSEDEIAITSLPMNYSFGLSIINSHLHVGASIVITNESITQRSFWELFKKHKVTSLSGVPYTFEIIKKFKLFNQELPSLKTITQAGGKLSNDLIQFFANFSFTNNLRFFVMYGQTEGTARLSYLEPQYLFSKLGSIGKPIPGGSFKIISENGDFINEPNISGELIYEGPNVMLGYSQTKSDLTKGDENNSILKTGDIAYFDNDGFFFINGRIKRFIKIFGNRVNLDELQNLIFQYGHEVVCLGTDNQLFIYILPETDILNVKEFIVKRLGIHPSVINLRIIDSFPKNSSGKILYSKFPKEL